MENTASRRVVTTRKELPHGPSRACGRGREVNADEERPPVHLGNKA